MLEYIDKKYKPGKDELVAEYHAEPAYNVSMEQACEQIAGESSIGTWTDICTMNEKIAKELKPHVFSIDGNEIKIAYPAELFEAGNMPQIYSAIAGNIFGMGILKNLRLQDISFPKSIVKSFDGPAFGIDGVRRILKIKKRPLVGTIVKPKVGLNPKQHAAVCYEAWFGGLDIVKDDENLTSMVFNKFEDRITETLKMKEKVEIETGQKKAYMPNVTAETNEMLRRAQYVKKIGGTYAMVDILTVGWSGLQTLRKANLGLVIHAHRAMHAALTANPNHGISMLALAKTARLIGVDQLHIGAIVGKMKGAVAEVKNIGEDIEHKMIKGSKKQHVLEQDWNGIKPVFPVCSGGLHPGKVAAVIEAIGSNVIIQAGGGVHGHPDGTRYGAKAMMQAVDAAVHGIELKKYAERFIELNKALKKWPG
jgi:ribulose-bisphosphate carboxylase large chain